MSSASAMPALRQDRRTRVAGRRAHAPMVERPSRSAPPPADWPASGGSTSPPPHNRPRAARMIESSEVRPCRAPDAPVLEGLGGGPEESSATVVVARGPSGSRSAPARPGRAWGSVTRVCVDGKTRAAAAQHEAAGVGFGRDVPRLRPGLAPVQVGVIGTSLAVRADRAAAIGAAPVRRIKEIRSGKVHRLGRMRVTIERALMPGSKTPRPRVPVIHC